LIMRMPDETVLQGIESRLGVSIDRDHYLSREGLKQSGVPSFFANKNLGDGSQLQLATYEKRVYIVDSSGLPFDKPIPILKTGRL